MHTKHGMKSQNGVLRIVSFITIRTLHGHITQPIIHPSVDCVKNHHHVSAAYEAGRVRCVHRPVFESFGDEPHGRRSYVLSKEAFEGAELSLTDDVVEGCQSLGRGPVYVRGDEVHEPVVCPFTPFYFLSEKTRTCATYTYTHSKYKHTLTHPYTNKHWSDWGRKCHAYPARYVLNDRPITLQTAGDITASSLYSAHFEKNHRLKGVKTRRRATF